MISQKQEEIHKSLSLGRQLCQSVSRLLHIFDLIVDVGLGLVVAFEHGVEQDLAQLSILVNNLRLCLIHILLSFTFFGRLV